MGAIFFLLSVVLFSTGVYLFLRGRHVLRILLGGELLIHAAAFNFIALGEKAPPDVSFFVLALIAVAAAEGCLILIFYLRITKQYQSTDVPLFDTTES